MNTVLRKLILNESLEWKGGLGDLRPWGGAGRRGGHLIVNDMGWWYGGGFRIG